MLRLPRLAQNLQIVDANGYPTTAFVIYWQQFASQIEASVNSIQDALEAAGIAQAAAVAANEAAAAAQGAADTAQAQADAAQAQTEAAKREAALQGSYIEPASVLTASPTTITVAAHTRFYADGGSVSVSGGIVSATSPSDVDYVSYIDPTRAGGAVSYVVSTIAPTQTGETHVVGAVTIPAAGTADGGDGPRRPGYVAPRASSI